MKAIPRNSLCVCGSGKKYKTCCAVKRTRSQWAAIASVALFAIAAVWVVASVVRNATDGSVSAPSSRVWSEEHGHWHDDGGGEQAPPPDVAPPGKVWSEEHGHWHDGAGEPASLLGASPPGVAPPGKVWSEEHGHWHDAGAPLPVSEPGYSEVDDLSPPIESQND